MCGVPERAADDFGVAVSVFESVRGVSGQLGDEQLRDVCLLSAGCGGVLALICAVMGGREGSVTVLVRGLGKRRVWGALGCLASCEEYALVDL